MKSVSSGPPVVFYRDCYEPEMLEWGLLAYLSHLGKNNNNMVITRCVLRRTMLEASTGQSDRTHWTRQLDI